MVEMTAVLVLKYCARCQEWHWHTQTRGKKEVCLQCWLDNEVEE